MQVDGAAGQVDRIKRLRRRLRAAQHVLRRSAGLPTRPPSFAARLLLAAGQLQRRRVGRRRRARLIVVDVHVRRRRRRRPDVDIARRHVVRLRQDIRSIPSRQSADSRLLRRVVRRFPVAVSWRV